MPAKKSTSAKRAAKSSPTAKTTKTPAKKAARNPKTSEHVLADVLPEQPRVATKQKTASGAPQIGAAMVALKTRTKVPAPSSKPVQRTLDQFLTTLTEKQRTRVGYHASRVTKGGWTFDGMSDVEMTMFVRNVGVPAAAAIFGVSEQQIRAKRSTAMGAPKRARVVVSAGEPRDVTTLAPSTQQRIASGRSRFTVKGPAITQSERAPDAYTTKHGTRQLVNDAHLAVSIATLKPGQRVKTPDSPSEGIAGQYATLVYVTSGRARVKLGGTRHISIKGNAEREAKEIDIESTRGVDWGTTTMVVPLNDTPLVSADDIERHGKIGALAIALTASDVIDDDDDDLWQPGEAPTAEQTAETRGAAAAFVF